MIIERADGRIKVFLNGWNPDLVEVTVSLKDEPGSREIAAVEEAKTEQGMPYVAVLIGPPPENPPLRERNKTFAMNGFCLMVNYSLREREWEHLAERISPSHCIHGTYAKIAA